MPIEKLKYEELNQYHPSWYGNIVQLSVKVNELIDAFNSREILTVAENLRFIERLNELESP